MSATKKKIFSSLPKREILFDKSRFEKEGTPAKILMKLFEASSRLRTGKKRKERPATRSAGGLDKIF